MMSQESFRHEYVQASSILESRCARPHASVRVQSSNALISLRSSRDRFVRRRRVFIVRVGSALSVAKAA